MGKLTLWFYFSYEVGFVEPLKISKVLRPLSLLFLKLQVFFFFEKTHKKSYVTFFNKFNSKELVPFPHPTLLQMGNVIISIKPVIDLETLHWW